MMAMSKERQDFYGNWMEVVPIPLHRRPYASVNFVMSLSTFSVEYDGRTVFLDPDEVDYLITHWDRITGNRIHDKLRWFWDTNSAGHPTTMNLDIYDSGKPPVRLFVGRDSARVGWAKLRETVGAMRRMAALEKAEQAAEATPEPKEPEPTPQTISLADTVAALKARVAELEGENRRLREMNAFYRQYAPR